MHFSKIEKSKTNDIVPLISRINQNLWIPIVSLLFRSISFQINDMMPFIQNKRGLCTFREIGSCNTSDQAQIAEEARYRKSMGEFIAPDSEKRQRTIDNEKRTVLYFVYRSNEFHNSAFESINDFNLSIVKLDLFNLSPECHASWWIIILQFILQALKQKLDDENAKLQELLNTECDICFKDHKFHRDPEPVISLPCSHRYHQSCYNNWNKMPRRDADWTKFNVCPKCRQVPDHIPAYNVDRQQTKQIVADCNKIVGQLKKLPPQPEDRFQSPGQHKIRDLAVFNQDSDDYTKQMAQAPETRKHGIGKQERLQDEEREETMAQSPGTRRSLFDEVETNKPIVSGHGSANLQAHVSRCFGLIDVEKPGTEPFTGSFFDQVRNSNPYQ